MPYWAERVRAMPAPSPEVKTDQYHLEIRSGPVLTGGAIAVDVAAVVVDVAPQLAALLGSHARVAIGVAVRGIARRHLLGRRRASRRAATESAGALSVLARRRKRGEQNQGDSAQCDQEPHARLHGTRHPPGRVRRLDRVCKSFTTLGPAFVTTCFRAALSNARLRSRCSRSAHRVTIRR